MASLGETVFPPLLFAPSFDHRPMQPLRIWFRRWEAATVTFTQNQCLPTLLLCALTSDLLGAVPHHHLTLSVKELTYSSN